MIAMWTAVVGVLFLPANGTQIAAAEADTTGTTTLGKRVIDHSFQLPLQVAWIVTALVGHRDRRGRSTDVGRRRALSSGGTSKPDRPVSACSRRRACRRSS